MKVAFHLRRRPECGPAAALLLPSRDVAGVLGLCARLGLDPSGRVFDVSGGFLLRLDEPTGRAFPGVVRLRGLAEDLFLPVDAEPVPALLDDEAEGLTRHRGLVVLPGGRVLGFDPRRPIDPGALLVGPPRPRRDWRPCRSDRRWPTGSGRSLVERPGESPESVLDAGAGARSGRRSPGRAPRDRRRRSWAGATLGAGRGLAWLGQALGLSGLARLGTSWIGRAMDLAPRLGEAVLGRQEAALRDLLHEFREGDLERALRRALPMGEPGGPRGGVADAGDRLPTHRTSYALGDLIGGTTGRRAGRLLVRRPGPHGRAGAGVPQGRDAGGPGGRLPPRGVHLRQAPARLPGRRAARCSAAACTTTRPSCSWPSSTTAAAAALAFEAAGEFDRAIGLYRTLGDHVAAGDLLRRIGEEDAALEEYRLAARLLVLTEGGTSRRATCS